MDSIEKKGERRRSFFTAHSFLPDKIVFSLESRFLKRSRFWSFSVVKCLNMYNTTHNQKGLTAKSFPPLYPLVGTREKFTKKRRRRRSVSNQPSSIEWRRFPPIRSIFLPSDSFSSPFISLLYSRLGCKKEKKAMETREKQYCTTVTKIASALTTADLFKSGRISLHYFLLLQKLELQEKAANRHPHVNEWIDCMQCCKRESIFFSSANKSKKANSFVLYVIFCVIRLSDTKLRQANNNTYTVKLLVSLVHDYGWVLIGGGEGKKVEGTRWGLSGRTKRGKEKAKHTCKDFYTNLHYWTETTFFPSLI